jgi:N-acetylneuraminic acid mutarotase
MIYELLPLFIADVRKAVRIFFFHLIVLLIFSPQLIFTQDVGNFYPNEWVAAANLNFPRVSHTATLLEDGKVLIAGYNNPAELYDPAANTFLVIGNTIYNHGQGASSTILNNGKVLIVGGINAQQNAELFNPQTGNFEPTGNLSAPHSFHSATKLPDGRVLIAGGQDNNGPQTHSVCEIYDPLTETFTLTDTLRNHRSSHKSVLLQSGKVLITGGTQTTIPGSGIYLKSCELFDPVSGTFSNIQNLNQPRTGHEITLLNNGRVLVSGGAYYQSACEIFDPDIETWSLTNPMTAIRRSAHSATKIYNGKVLLAGGNISYLTAKAELFDPVTNSFTEIDSMITPRQQHTATLLNDGSVFVTGGYSTNGVTNHTERYLIDTTVVGVQGNENINSRMDFKLLQNYPNPFNPSTKISWQSPVRSHQVLTVFDVLGNEIATLVNKEIEAGYHSVDFNASSPALGGQALPSGVYFYQLKAGSFVETKKMILLR